MATEIVTDELGQPKAAMPVREVAGVIATDETGRPVESMPVRYVEGAIDTVTGRALPVTPVEIVAGLITTNEVGQAVPVRPVRVVTTPTVTDSAGRVVASVPVRSGTPAPVVIGGVEVGTVGAAGTLYENYKLIEGDDFVSPPSRWSGRNLSGKYAHSALSVGFRQTSTADSAMYVDPAFRGARSQSPTDLGYDRVSVSNSILTLTASAPEAEILPFLPTTYTGGRGDANNRPPLLTGSLKTAPHFMLSAQADWIVECRVRLPSGVARGYWPSFWTSTFFWPDRGEVDIVEVKKDASGNMTSLMNVYGNISNGSPAEFTTVATPAYAAGQWINVMAKRVGNTIFFYDDAATPGTYALRGSTTNYVARFSGAHDIRLDLAVSNNWDASTFSAGDWPKSVEFDWWRVWVPTAAGPNRPTQILPAVNTTPGGSWAATFPSATTLHGSGAGLEQVTGAFDNYDAPGFPTRNTTTRLPTSMTVDLSARTVSGTVPTTEGGCLPILITYAYDDGTPASRVMLPFNVAPAVQSIFGNQSVIEGAAVNLSVAYTAFHSGNLGPHTYTATSDKGWLTITGNGTQSLTITGTAPADDVATITVNCTNSIGQVTTVTRTVTATAAPSLFFEDDFNAAGGTLAGRVANSGGTWATHPLSSATHSLSGAGGGGIYQPTTDIGWMTNNQTVPNANYYVEADLLVKSVLGGGPSISVNGRMDASALTFYGIRYTGTAFILYKSVAGTLTTLATYTATQATGVLATVRLEMNGDQISGLVDGVLRMGPVTDADITAAGRVGTRMYGNNATPTTGQHLEGMRAGRL
ncbi:MAG: glycoside hydrolase family 16 protein [Pseudomonadota bacterium]